MTEPTAFHDMQNFLELPRISGLTLSPDGQRLITSVSTLNPERNGFGAALWAVDPRGQRPATRLTLSARGERSPAFTPDGDLLFVSARPDPRRKPEEDQPDALWLLPAAGGEARAVGSRPGGVAAPTVAERTGTILVTGKTMPGAVTAEQDEQRRTARKDDKISAILHTGYPVRYWDHDLGPDQPRLLVADPVADGERLEWRDLTPNPGGALYECHAELSPDGATAVTSWRVPLARGTSQYTVVSIDVATGTSTTLLADHEYRYGKPRISPDGATVVTTRERLSTPDSAPEVDLVLIPLHGGEPRVLTGSWDSWPAEVRWTPDSTSLIVTADQHGRCPLFRLSVADAAVLRLTGDNAAYTDPCVSPDGATVYALRSAVDAAPAPVRLDSAAPDQHPTPLPGPARAPELPGRLVELAATAEDGTALRGWLALPATAADPAPLLLWVHGGPLNSWNCWHWRWNPWLMVANGYAVLLPDPALSTGYGQEFVQRGWGSWGDAACARPDIDAARTAAMGGSFGGYMVNWIAGHTDRFDAIVSHASLWALDQFGATTDVAYYWSIEMTREMAEVNSPHHHVAAINTPMLLIHGDRDYRVPIGEALRLWYELQAQQPDPETQPHRFLYFPDENHWVLKPQHAALWYQTVLAFLNQHVRGQPFATPELLR